jgi:hypothetical protein
VGPSGDTKAADLAADRGAPEVPAVVAQEGGVRRAVRGRRHETTEPGLHHSTDPRATPAVRARVPKQRSDAVDDSAERRDLGCGSGASGSVRAE